MHGGQPYDDVPLTSAQVRMVVPDDSLPMSDESRRMRWQSGIELMRVQLTAARLAAAAAPRVPRGCARRALVVSQEGMFAVGDDPSIEVVSEALRQRGHVIVGVERWDDFKADGLAARRLAGADALIVLAGGDTHSTPFLAPEDALGRDLRGWVAGGGTFAVVQAEDRAHTFHRLFDKAWKYKWYSRLTHTFNPGAASAAVFAHPACLPSMNIKAVLFEDVPPHEAVFSGTYGEDIAVAVACGAFGDNGGTVTSIGDVNLEKDTLRVLCALVGAARPPPGASAVCVSAPVVDACSVCGAPKALMCARCKTTRYCAKPCQLFDRKGHKAVCNEPPSEKMDEGEAL